VDLLQYGYPMGYKADNLPVSEVHNHKGATEFSEFIDTYLESQILKNLMLGPPSVNPLQLP